MLSRIARIASLAALALALAGCYESAEVTHHEPGVYKGDQDPLMNKLEGESDLDEQLDRRFDGQRDR